MENIKLIVCDLDGTLLRSDKSISSYAIGVLEKCSTLGIKIVLATARSERGAIKVVSPFVPDFIISSGGAKITRGEEVLFSSKIPPKIVRDIIAMCRQFTGGKGEITVETDSGHYWDYKVKPQENTVESNCFYTDFKDFDEPAYKITAELENDEHCKEIVNKYPQLAFSGYKGEPWKRFAMHGADKPNGVRRVCEYLDITPSHAIAFGDDYNDVEMLKLCGTGVAMENAANEAKEAADFIAASNDSDGVAKFLEEKFWVNYNDLR